MKNIGLKLKIEELSVLNELLSKVDYSMTADKTMQQKASISILIKISNSLKKHAITKQFKTKAFKINYPYHEAYFLHNIVSNFTNEFDNAYSINVLSRIIADLNKQLV